MQGSVTVADAFLNGRADCSFVMQAVGILHCNWKPLLEAGVAAQEGKSLWNHVGFVK